MKIAILSDIHGNIEAFKEILTVAQKDGIEKFFFLGDFVGYYCHPEKVLELLSKLDAISIQGNHERILKGLIDKTLSLEDISEKYGRGHEYALKNLSEKQIDFLVNLPESLNVSIDGCIFRLYHGSPIDSDQYIYPDTSLELLRQCNIENTDFVLIGHSHYQFLYRNSDSLLVNVGSVGQSRSKGGLAQWATINTDNMCLELRSTPYATDELIKETSLIDPNVPYLTDVLKRN